MNLIAVDIGNTNINIGLFVNDKEKSTETIAGTNKKKLTEHIKSCWEQIPVSRLSKEKKRDGIIIVCSVKPRWTEIIKQIAKDSLNEKIHIIGKDIPYPINLSVDEPEKIGPDRVLAASAAYAVVEGAVVVVDVGTAVTVDLIDDRGVFVGGCIFPGFEMSAKALNKNTALLPKIKVTRPKLPFGKNTKGAINAGLYFSTVGALEEIIRRYAEKTGSWPQTIITGAGAETIKDDCPFIDSYVPNLVIKGIAMAYRKYIEVKSF